MKNTIFSVTFKFGSQVFKAKYAVKNCAASLISIVPTSNREWGPPHNMWGYAKMMRTHVLRRWQEKGKPPWFIFDTQFWDAKELIGTP